MQFLKQFSKPLLLLGAVVITLVALVILTAPENKPATPKVTKGELSGANARPVAGGLGGAELTDSQISAYQDKLKTKPNDSVSLARLGLAYLQKVREIGDPTYYGKAEGVLKKALEIDPKNVEALGGMGSLSLSRHQFAQGLEWGQKAQQLKPDQSYNYGVMGDALVELGRYDEAVTIVQRMVDLRPDISSYARVSYLRELYGKYDEAIEAMQEAVTAGGPTLENRAYVTYQLGNLYFNKGDLAKAEESYQQAMAYFPNYVYAQAGMGKIKAARGDLEGAIALYLPVTQRMPLAEFIIELGDLYAAAGKTTEANRQYELVRTISKLYADNGVDSDLEMALFDADHDNKLPEALARARQQMKIRPSIKASDVLAWTLYKTGDYQAAAEASKQALRLGTRDSLMYFHAGMIAAKLGQTAEAKSWLEKALAQNPNFSFRYAPIARQTLTTLGGAASGG